jgi:hypothetical protein
MIADVEGRCVPIFKVSYAPYGLPCLIDTDISLQTEGGCLQLYMTCPGALLHCTCSHGAAQGVSECGCSLACVQVQMIMPMTTDEQVPNSRCLMVRGTLQPCPYLRHALQVLWKGLVIFHKGSKGISIVLNVGHHLAPQLHVVAAIPMQLIC